ncbi:N-acetylmuramoyl-L-alanine amidase [Maritimibacter sp. DP1N21-5]|uniref:N-acetylmuramoyl-L-alanine amidase n=1 Tax=Maritimibacter sp. DP1N21-5 TaxID=2836867 RepID=UPI001C4898C8|nr:N-acetylmuramoyl-L-alanine amidase [Maritimibacter sp. DP1N21-5]MBV7409744.1 N-acetylmuramoyl-L-alanine amidase [Maritimibacter sp. DP1N21-5]
MFGRLILVFSLLLGSAASAQDGLTALSRLNGEGLTIAETERGVTIGISMNRSVPWRVFTLEDPLRLVVDFSELDWDGVDGDTGLGLPAIATVNTGLFRPGWSRLVIEMTTPLAVERAAMRAEGQGAKVEIALVPTDPERFSATAGAPASATFDLAELPVPPASGPGDFVVVIDPGHGGIDPGAEREGVREADLVLTFARELEEAFLRDTDVTVVLTRNEDVFVPLEERVSLARKAGADVFLSLHADALSEGRASGATVYTLSDDASDIASQKLAERHDRGDLLAGVDLTEADDTVALVLMDLARTDTQPRSDALADAIVEGIREATGSTYKTPRMSASFSVLKAPDIPSVLIELGFLSSKRDFDKLNDPEWRAAMAAGIKGAVMGWSETDAATAPRLRQ